MTLHLALGTSLGKEIVSQVEIKVMQMATYRAEPKTWSLIALYHQVENKGQWWLWGKCQPSCSQSCLYHAKMSHLDEKAEKELSQALVPLPSNQIILSFCWPWNKMNGNYWVQRWIYLGIAEKLQFRTSKLWRAIGEFKKRRRLAFIRSGRNGGGLFAGEKKRSGLWWFLIGSKMYLCERSCLYCFPDSILNKISFIHF